MSTVAVPHLDLADIQGNILTAYGKLGFPKGCILLLNIRDAAKGRVLLNALLPRVTTALRWRSSKQVHMGPAPMQRPDVALNLAFTFWGLLSLNTPIRTLPLAASRMFSSSMHPLGKPSLP